MPIASCQMDILNFLAPPLSEKPKRVSLVMTALVPIVTKSPTTYIADSDTRNIGPDRLKL